jgi:hypothetical protein
MREKQRETERKRERWKVVAIKTRRSGGGEKRERERLINMRERGELIGERET